MSWETEALPGSRVEQTWVAGGHGTATCNQNGNKTKPFVCRTRGPPGCHAPRSLHYRNVGLGHGLAAADWRLLQKDQLGLGIPWWEGFQRWPP